MSVSPVEGLDFEAALKQFQMEKVYQRILKAYVSSTPEILAKLEALAAGALQGEELGEYITTVHGLKGACYGIMANSLGDMAKTLEFAGKDGDIEQIRALNGGLVSEACALRERVQAYLDAAG
jgi:HPt (histidine-containing phosphotransfer) domain-containing protein